MQMPELGLMIFVFVFGLCVGSFLNVCIHRIPESKSIVSPGSMCPRCGQTIRFYDNIPLLSYLLLRGRCRNCRTSISIRYPLVELLSGALAVSVVLKYGLTPEAAAVYGFIAVLTVITFIDIDHRIIPDVISLPGIAAFFLAARLVPSVTWKDSLIGILAGGGSLLLVAWIYHLVTRKEGMGGGDIKLLAMIGAMVGWKGVLFTIFVSSATGTVIGLIVMLVQRRNLKLAVPFGPFLAFGAVAYLFVGPQVIQWYLQPF